MVLVNCESVKTITKNLPTMFLNQTTKSLIFIRRAALPVHLNVARGCSGKSETERKRFYEVAGGSVIEIDAALDIASDLGYLKEIETDNLGKFMINCFKILTGMI